MDFTYFTSDTPFLSSFQSFLHQPQRPSYSFPALSLEDFDSREVGLYASKNNKIDEDSPSEFFAATRQSTDMTNFSESTPIDISNFFDMQGCPQSHANFSLVDSINWDNKYNLAHSQSLQGLQLESKDDLLNWTNDRSHGKTTALSSDLDSEMTPNETRKGKLAARKPSMEENEEMEDNEEGEDDDSKTLIRLAELHKNDWKKIAKVYKDGKMSPNALKTKFKELMASSLQKRIKFTHKEDLMIAYYFEKIGSNWSQMANFFPNRTGIMLKNRYYSFIRKRNLLSELVEEGREYEFEGDCGEKNYQGNQVRVMTSTLGLYNSKLNLNAGLGSQEGLYNRESIEKQSCGKMKKDIETPEQKEVRLLKKKVKSLESLCEVTRRELNKFVKAK